MMIDSGSTTNGIDQDTFNRIQKKNSKIVFKKSSTKLYPYASKPLKIIGSFSALFETKEHISSDKVFVIEQRTAGNLLGIKVAEELELLNIVNKLNGSVPQNDYAQIIPIIPKEIQQLMKQNEEMFHGNGTMRDYECTLHVNKDIKPVYQKMRRYPIHLRDEINKEVMRLENAGIIESVTGPQDWVSNLVATPKSDQSVRLCLDARAINNRN